MPYLTNADLPDSIKNSLPEEAQNIWRETVNKSCDDQDIAFATAWSALRKTGWSKTGCKWEKKDSSGVAKEFVFDIKKSDDEKRLVFGWTMISRDAQGNVVWDKQNDSIDPEDLEELCYKYVRFYRDVGELHINSGMGVLIESVVTTIEKQKIWGIPEGVMPVGWWTGFYISDDSVWENVKNGLYRAFSIEGTATRVPVEE